MAQRKIPKYVVAHHPDQPGEFLMPGGTQGNIKSAVRYKAQPGDLFLCNYPKCGITWLQNIVWRLLRNGEPIVGDLRNNVAFLEFEGAEAVAETRKDGKYHVIKTHFPYKWVPKHPEAKYIFIAREPKDVCVSLYYHIKGFPHYEWEDGSFDDLASGFVEGRVDSCDYFDMVNEWYWHRNEPAVLFLLYEDLLTDTKATVLKIATFLGQEYVKSLEKHDERMLEGIVRETSFEKMKSEENKWIHYARTLPFIRKGIIGDWTNHMTPHQAIAIDQKLEITAAGNGLEKLWTKWKRSPSSADSVNS